MTMTVEERLGRIEENISHIAEALPSLCKDVDELKEFKWKTWGAMGVIVPVYTAMVATVVTIMAHYVLGW